jgi:hypothetical protein
MSVLFEAFPTWVSFVACKENEENHESPSAACGRNQTPTRQSAAPRPPLGRMEVAQENNEEGRNAGRQEQ